MPSVLRFKCNKCTEEFENRFDNSYYNSLELIKEMSTKGIVCLECGYHEKKLECMEEIQIPQLCQSFSIGESHRPGESAKPDSYWANAEQNRKHKLKKRYEEQKEKAFYDGDSSSATVRQKEKAIKKIDLEHKKNLENG